MPDTTDIDRPDHSAADRRKTLAAALGLGLATALTGYLSYAAMFSSFAWYDDEGYVLVSIRAYNRGARLFDDVYSQYGPFFYQTMHVVWSALGLSATHDAGRLVTIGIWIATSLLTGVITFRITRRPGVATVVQLLTFHSLLQLCNVPMHPGGMLCLLLVVLIAIPMALAGHPRATLVILGAIGAAMALVKINVGAFALVSVGFALVMALPRRPSLRAVQLVATAMLVLLPVLLMAPNLHREWVLRYAIHVAAAAVALAIVSWRMDPGETRRPTELLWLLLGAAAATLCICGVALLRGTSLRALVDGVFLLPLRMPAISTVPMPWTRSAPVLELCAVAASFVSAEGLLRRRQDPASETARRTASLASSLGRLAVGGLLWLTAGGVFARFPLELVALPLAWVAAVAPRPPGLFEERPGPSRFVRHLLVSVAVLQALHAYPVAGSQIAWGSFLLIPIGGLCVSDGLGELALLVGTAGRGPASRATRALTAAPALLFFGLLAFSLGMAHRQYQAVYRSGVPLPFPGATLLHLPADQRDAYVWVTGQVQDRCDAFVTLPGMNSLYLFSGREPPTDLNATAWMFLFTPATQSRIVERIKRVDRLCVVLNRRFLAGWANGRPLPRGPLLEYITRELRPLEGKYGFELLVR